MDAPLYPDHYEGFDNGNFIPREEAPYLPEELHLMEESLLFYGRSSTATVPTSSCKDNDLLAGIHEKIKARDEKFYGRKHELRRRQDFAEVDLYQINNQTTEAAQKDFTTAYLLSQGGGGIVIDGEKKIPPYKTFLYTKDFPDEAGENCYILHRANLPTPTYEKSERVELSVSTGWVLLNVSGAKQGEKLIYRGYVPVSKTARERDLVKASNPLSTNLMDLVFKYAGEDFIELTQAYAHIFSRLSMCKVQVIGCDGWRVCTSKGKSRIYLTDKHTRPWKKGEMAVVLSKTTKPGKPKFIGKIPQAYKDCFEDPFQLKALSKHIKNIIDFPKWRDAKHTLSTYFAMTSADQERTAVVTDNIETDVGLFLGSVPVYFAPTGKSLQHILRVLPKAGRYILAGHNPYGKPASTRVKDGRISLARLDGRRGIWPDDRNKRNKFCKIVTSLAPIEPPEYHPDIDLMKAVSSVATQVDNIDRDPDFRQKRVRHWEGSA